MNTHNRRITDRYPLSSRIHWRAMAWLDGVSVVDAACFCAIGVIYGGGMWVVAQWMLGA